MTPTSCYTKETRFFEDVFINWVAALILQRIYIPDSAGKAGDLYSDSFDKDRVLCGRIWSNNRLSFNTLLNSFSIEKWKKYTQINNLTFTVFASVDSEISIEVYHAFLLDGSISVQPVAVSINSKIILNESEGRKEKEIKACFQELPDCGILYPVICFGNAEQIYDGYYETAIEEYQLNDVHLAIGICTFKREQCLKKITDKIEKIWESSRSCLTKESLSVYIVDNGNTLDTDAVSKRGMKIFPNKNAGGSSGFARAMMEAASTVNDENTHLIVMDDDIELPDHTLDTTYSLLRLLRREYLHCVIGGNMMDLQEKFRLCESGAYYHIPRYSAQIYGRERDLRNLKELLLNEQEKKVNYTGWWYACIPIPIIRKIGLPMPFFIHFDDIEYGMRLEEGSFISLNHIFVWHPSVIGKAPPWDRYYVRRNSLIMNTSGKEKCSRERIAALETLVILRDLFRYRYEEVEYELLAIRDYCEGPLKMAEEDASLKHPFIKAYQSSVTVNIADIKKKIRKKCIYRRMSVADYLRQVISFYLPEDKEPCFVNRTNDWLPFRTGTLFERYKNEKTVRVLKRDRKRSVKLFFSYLRIMCLFSAKYDVLCDEWGKEKGSLCSEESWAKLLYGI